jgi:hypothetical protein
MPRKAIKQLKKGKTKKSLKKAFTPTKEIKSYARYGAPPKKKGKGKRKR